MTGRFVPPDLQRLLEMASAGVDILAFITVSHPQMDKDVHLVLDDVDYLINGVTWTRAKGVKLKPVTDTDQAPRSTFSFPNVDYTTLIRLEDVVDPASVAFFYASSEAFDRRTNPRQLKVGAVLTPFWPHQGLQLTDVSVAQDAVSGTLRGADYSQEQYPNLLVTEELFPGVYAQ